MEEQTKIDLATLKSHDALNIIWNYLNKANKDGNVYSIDDCVLLKRATIVIRDDLDKKAEKD